MRILVTIGIVALTLSACGTKAQPPKVVPSPSAASTVSASASPSHNDYGIGMPPEPSAENRKIYLAELNRIDPDIVHDKEATAVSRGRNQCSAMKSFPGDEAKWIDLTLNRFTSPRHPDGFGRVKAAKILVVVRKYICPTY